MIVRNNRKQFKKLFDLVKKTFDHVISKGLWSRPERSTQQTFTCSKSTIETLV